MEQYFQCFQTRCIDFHPAVCGSTACGSHIDGDALQEFAKANGGPTSEFWSQQWSTTIGWVRAAHICPRTCQTCGEQGSQLQNAPCQRGWSHADGACFKYNYDREFVDKNTLMVTWDQAEMFCRAEGAHLATITTPAQEHLVFQLVKQRPPEVTATGLWAWVGLWSGPGGCSHGVANYSWIGSPESGVMDRLTPERCRCAFDRTSCGPTGLYTNSAGMGETMQFKEAEVDWRRRAWICSKPALYRAVTDGSCRAAGLSPITDTATCEAAVRSLLGMKRIVRRDMDPAKPSGCFTTSAAGKIMVAEHFAGQELSTGHGEKILLCQNANATNATAEETAAAADAAQAASWKPPRRQEAAATFTPPVLALVLALGLCPAAALFAAVAWDALLAIKSQDISLVRAWRSLWAPYGDKRFAAAVDAKFQRWRDAIVKAAALLRACFYTGELLRTSLVPEAVCADAGVLPVLRELLAAVHLANVWAAIGLLALHRCRACKGSAVPRLAFLVAIVALELAEATLLGEQALLVESRLWRQLLWRLFFGACTSPALALAGNALLASGMCAIYFVLVPDGMIFTVGSTRGGLLSEQGCNSLWEASTANSIATAVHEMAKTFDHWTGSVMKGAGDLLEETLKRPTSFLDFAFSEAAIVAVVAVCLMLLHFILQRDISQSLQLQSSTGQLSAVSRVLSTLCDATFELSSDYRVAAPAPKLDVILHLSPTPGGMKGQDFRDVAASTEDRSRVQEALRPGSSCGVLEGEAMYLDLRSAGNAALRVQLLCAEFTDLYGERCLLCGINELQKDQQFGGGEGPDAEEFLGPLPGLASAVEAHKSGRRSESRDKSKEQGTPAKVEKEGSLSGSEQGSELDGSKAPESRKSPSEGSGGSRSRTNGPGGSRTNSPVGSRQGRLGHGAGLPNFSDGRAKDVSRQNFTVEVTTNGASVLSASSSFKTFLGLELKPGFKLASVAQDPGEFAASLRACVESADSSEGGSKQELRIVLNAFPAGAGGGRQKHPYELSCTAEVVAPDSAAPGSGPSPPTIRLQVLSARYAKHRKRPIAAASSSSGAVAPTRIGQARINSL